MQYTRSRGQSPERCNGGARVELSSAKGVGSCCTHACSVTRGVSADVDVGDDGDMNVDVDVFGYGS